MPLKREPDSFPQEGMGGASHRYDALSKADWADAYADLYRQVFGEDATAETILADVERRDDIRRVYAKQKPAKRPQPATAEDKAWYHGTCERMAVMNRAFTAGDMDEYYRLKAIHDDLARTYFAKK